MDILVSLPFIIDLPQSAMNYEYKGEVQQHESQKGTYTIKHLKSRSSLCIIFSIFLCVI